MSKTIIKASLITIVATLSGLTLLPNASAFKIDFLEVTNKPIHEAITIEALKGFEVSTSSGQKIGFDKKIMEFISEKTAQVDEVGFANPVLHFDADGLDASNNILFQKKKVIAELLADPGSIFWKKSEARAQLGYALHTVQDFYAHSNWVENKVLYPNLPMPALGRVSALKTVDEFFVAAGRPSYLSNIRPTCGAEKLSDTAPLATGFYTYAMHDYGYQNDKTDTPSKREKLGLWTNGWNSAIPDLKWPDNRCIHGGDGPNRKADGNNDSHNVYGLNKDAPDRDNHYSARAYAVEASRLYVQDVLAQVRLAAGSNADSAVCALMGLSDDASCLAPSSMAGVIQKVVVNPSPRNETGIFAGLSISVDVIGERLPSNLTVRLGTVDCIRIGSQTQTLLKVECTAVKSGVIDLSVISDTGIQIRSQPVLVQAASLSFLPSVPNIYETVKFYIIDYSSLVAKAVWSFSETVAGMLETATDFAGKFAEHVFTSSGLKSAKVILKDRNGVVIDTKLVSLQVADVRVDSVAPLVAVIGQRLMFDVIGSNLQIGLSFQLTDCANIAETAVSTDSSRRSFSCTFPPGTQPGSKNGAIGPVGSAGSPFEKALKIFQVDVSSPSPGTANLFSDRFDGTALDSTYWTSTGSGALSVTSGFAILNCAAQVNTKGKLEISGDKGIVIEARFAGTGYARSSGISLYDVLRDTTDAIAFGDTNYSAWNADPGMFLNGSGTFGTPMQFGNGRSTSMFKEYRLTIIGKAVTIERGDTLATITEQYSVALPNSIVGHKFYLSFWSGSPPFCPGTSFDWISVREP